MSERIVMRTGESLVAGGPPFTAAEPEVVIGELDGPVGTAIATLTGLVSPPVGPGLYLAMDATGLKMMQVFRPS